MRSRFMRFIRTPPGRRLHPSDGGPVRYVPPVLFLLALLSLPPSHVLAHHSISAFADPSKLVSLNGRLTKVEWVNPHILIYVDVDVSGQTQPWKFQGAAPSWWRSVGVGKTNFAKHIGEKVTVSGNVARDGSAYGYFLKLAFANGDLLETTAAN